MNPRPFATLFALTFSVAISLVLSQALLAGSPEAPNKPCDSCTLAPEKMGESALSGDIGLNIVTSSYYRGVTRAGAAHAPSFQPYLNLSLKTHEQDGFLNKAVVSLGLWQSFINPAFYKAIPAAAPTRSRSWYESVFTPSVALTFGKITLTETYHFILFPNEIGTDAQGLSSKLAYDDSDLLGAFALNPSITHTVETSGKLAFVIPAQTQKGHSWEFAIAPSASAGAVSVSLPVSLVFGSNGFYNRNGYAYLSAGLQLAYSLPVPKNLGNWSVNTGATYYNTDRQATGNSSNHDLVGSLGLGIAF